MTNQTVNLDPDCRQRIDRYLDAVDQVLQGGGVGRSARRQITDDLQNQILEMLAARAGESPKPADVEALLAELDQPEAYGRGPMAEPCARAHAGARKCLVDGKRLGIALGLMNVAVFIAAVAFLPERESVTYVNGSRFVQGGPFFSATQWELVFAVSAVSAVFSIALFGLLPKANRTCED